MYVTLSPCPTFHLTLVKGPISPEEWGATRSGSWRRCSAGTSLVWLCGDAVSGLTYTSRQGKEKKLDKNGSAPCPHVPMSPCPIDPCKHAGEVRACMRSRPEKPACLPARPTAHRFSVCNGVSLVGCPLSLAWDSAPKWVRGSEDVRKGAAGFACHPISEPTCNQSQSTPRYFALRTHCPLPTAPLSSARPFSRSSPFARCPVSAGWDLGRSKKIRTRNLALAGTPWFVHGQPASLGSPQEPYPTLLKTVSGPGMGGVPVQCVGGTPAPGTAAGTGTGSVPPLRAATVHVHSSYLMYLLPFWIADAGVKCPSIICQGVACLLSQTGFLLSPYVRVRQRGREDERAEHRQGKGFAKRPGLRDRPPHQHHH